MTLGGERKWKRTTVRSVRSRTRTISAARPTTRTKSSCKDSKSGGAWASPLGVSVLFQFPLCTQSAALSLFHADGPPDQQHAAPQQQHRGAPVRKTVLEKKCSSYFAEAYVTGQRIPRRERQLPFPVAQTPVKLCQKSANAQQTQDQTVLAALRMGPENTQRPSHALTHHAGVADGLPISADSRSQPGQFRPGLRDLTMWIMHHQTFPFLRLVNDPRSSPAAAENSQMTMTKRLAPRPL